MRPEAPYQLPVAYIFNWCRSLTTPFSEAGLHPPEAPHQPHRRRPALRKKSPKSPLPYRPNISN